MSERKVFPMGRGNEDDDFVIGYMCLVDFECELGLAAGGNEVFASEADCRKSRSCVEGCGIVEVEVRARRIVHEGTDHA